MLARNLQRQTVRVMFSFLIAVVLVWGLVGCSNPSETSQLVTSDSKSETRSIKLLSEVPPPPVIQQLSESLEAYQPQVAIKSPKPDEVLEDTKVSVQFQVQDLPIFKNSQLGMGPHLHVILDNQPYIPVYDLDQPLVFEDLSPGTHTLRVFASRPWHESFKNEGAYAQTTFHLFTKSADNNPNPSLPLLTYSRPQGNYGAEPIMLDFYLTNAPLHLVAQENSEDDIADWRIRITINGETFVLDRWQPIYLKGFKPGKNWVHLEFLDEEGNPVNNAFNNTVRLLDYQPKGNDTLAQLMRGELSTEAARGIVDPNYKAPPAPAPEVKPAPIPLPATPTVEETKAAAPEVPKEILAPTTEPTKPEETPTAELKPTEAAPVSSAETAKSEETPTVKVEIKEVTPPPSAEPAKSEETPTVKVEIKEVTAPPSAEPAKSEETPTVKTKEATPAPPSNTKQTEQTKTGGIFSRLYKSVLGFFQNLKLPSLPLTQPKPNTPAAVEEPKAVQAPITPDLETPPEKSVVVPTQPETKASATPSQLPAVVEEPQAVEKAITPEPETPAEKSAIAPTQPETKVSATPSPPPVVVEEPQAVKASITPEPETPAAKSAIAPTQPEPKASATPSQPE